MITWLVACNPEPPPTAEPTTPSIFEPATDARLARRVSIDLRGVLPTVEETDQAVAGDLDGLIEDWLADPLFEAHLADSYSEEWLLNVDELGVEPEEFGFDRADAYAFTRTAGEEPARLIAHVAASDLPWTEIVTADWTMANSILEDEVRLAWIDPDPTKEWREARYLDGRPPGGVLMTTGLWLRYDTTLFNYNRGRAARLAWLLLCYDFLTRPVAFSAIADNTTTGLEEAVSTDPGCLACHATLDPLAGNLFGFWPFENKDGRELVTYHPEREGWGETYTGMKPGYFGTPLDGAAQLGPMVAKDPRFSMCTASRTASRLYGRELTYADLPEVASYRDALVESWQYKDLLRAVLASDEYRAGALKSTATEDQLATLRPLRTLTPRTLGSLVEDLTGFRWTWSNWDQLESDEFGYRLLLGGADGDMVVTTNLGPGLSRSLVLQRLAQAAAMYVVPADMGLPAADRRLLGTTTDDIPTEVGPALDAELTALHLRLFSVEPDADELAEESALYAEVLALSDAETAWESVLSVLFRDPDFWSY